jgi:hypothetical protein
MTTVDKSTKFASTFDPRYIPDCALWLDGSDSSSNSMTLSGSNITTWKDKSVNGYSFTPVSGTITKTTGSNNRSCVSMGTNRMSTPSFAWRTNFTIFYIVFTAAGKFLCATGNPSTTVLVATFNPILYIVSDTYTANSSTNPSISANAWAMFCLGYANGTDLSNFTVNGTTRTTSAGILTVTDVTYSGQPLYINGNVVSSSDTSSVAEIILYNRSVSTTERQVVEGYLAWKWGLSGNLPSTHPYSPSLAQIPSPSYMPILKTFSPTNISGCIFWIDASDKSTFSIDGSSNVTLLSDKSEVTPKVLTKYGTPTWSNVGLDGTLPNLPAFDTNAGGWVVNLGSNLTNFTSTIFIVTRLTVNPTTNGSCAVGLAKTSTGSTACIRALDWATSNLRTVVFDGVGASVITIAAPTVGSRFLFSTSYSGTSPYPAYNYLNGGASTSSANTRTASATTSHATIGCNPDTFSGGLPILYWQNGKISEVLIFNSVLSANDRNTIEGYLAHKWKLPANLPAAHIYKKFYPMINSFYSV